MIVGSAVHKCRERKSAEDSGRVKGLNIGNPEMLYDLEIHKEKD